MHTSINGFRKVRKPNEPLYEQHATPLFSEKIKTQSEWREALNDKQRNEQEITFGFTIPDRSRVSRVTTIPPRVNRGMSFVFPFYNK